MLLFLGVEDVPFYLKRYSVQLYLKREEVSFRQASALEENVHESEIITKLKLEN